MSGRSPGWASRRVALALLGAGLAAAPLLNARTPQSASPAATSSGSSVAPADVLNKYCVGCHNDRLKTAGLQIDTLQASPIADHAPQWEKIVTRLRTGEMPPPGRPRPIPPPTARSSRRWNGRWTRPRLPIRTLVGCPCIA